MKALLTILRFIIRFLAFYFIAGTLSGNLSNDHALQTLAVLIFVVWIYWEFTHERN